MSEACACVYVGDYDGPEFCSTTHYVARQEHKCIECGRAIVKGERYEYVSGKWDGSMDVFKTCEDCESVRDAFFCDGFLYGGIWEYLGEHLRDVIAPHGANVDSSCIIPLTPRARDKVCDMIEDIWQWHCDDEEDGK
jgi:hypothetical protein